MSLEKLTPPHTAQSREKTEELTIVELESQLVDLDARSSSRDSEVRAENLRIYEEVGGVEATQRMHANGQALNDELAAMDREKTQVGEQIAAVLWKSGAVHFEENPGIYAAIRDKAVSRTTQGFLEEAIQELQQRYPALNHPKVLKPILPKLLKEFVTKESQKRKEIIEDKDAAERGEGLGLRTKDEAVARHEQYLTEHDRELDGEVRIILNNLGWR